MNQYGPYLMYFLSRLMQQRMQGEDMNKIEELDEIKDSERYLEKDEIVAADDIAAESMFAKDETCASWHKETNVDILISFCREGFGQAKKHGHFIIGIGEKGSFIGIPGRFYIAEQPAGGKTGFTLWQALAGGESFCDNPEEMDEDLAENIYGYWIARLDSETLEISEV